MTRLIEFQIDLHSLSIQFTKSLQGSYKLSLLFDVITHVVVA